MSCEHLETMSGYLTACRARQPGPAQNVAAQNVAARSADLTFEIRGLSSQSTPSPQATLGGESRFTNHASRMSGRPHRRTQGPVETKGLSTAEALRTNYGTNRTPVAPVPSRLAAEVLGR